MARKKKYANGGGVPKYTRQDSLDVKQFRIAADAAKINPLNITSFEKGTPDYKRLWKTWQKSRKMGDVYGTTHKHKGYGSIYKIPWAKAGALKDTLPMKKGGIVKKGNRNMFTEQYD